MKQALLFVVLWAACAKSAPPVSCPPPAQPAAVVVPPPDAALARWQAIKAAGFAVPADTTAAALVPELVAYLGSPDPVRRDAIAYDAFAAWLGNGTLTDADAKALATTLVAGTRDASVFRRTFSLLVLAEVARRDAKAPLFSDAERRDLIAAVRAYADTETDLRGHTGAQGWAHGAAHAADLIAQLAKHPALAEADRLALLDAIAAFVVRRHGTILAYGEDGRFAVAALNVVNRGVPQAALDAWLMKLAGPLMEKLTPVFDPGLFAAQRNARNLLFTLFTQTALAATPTAGEQQLLASLRTLLQ